MSTAQRWTRVAPVLFFVFIANFMDRINIGMGTPYITHQFALSGAQMGLVSSLALLSYAILQIPGGVWANRFSARKYILGAMIVWGLAAAATGIAWSYGSMLAFRILLGLAEGGVWPAIAVIIARWYPRWERARASAMNNISVPLAGVFMAPLAGLLIAAWGWRTMFIVEALPALIMAVIFYFLVSDSPSQDPRLSDEERQYLQHNVEEVDPGVERMTMGQAMRRPTVLLMTTAGFFWQASFYGFALWLPTVVTELTHLGIRATGVIVALPYIAAFVCMFLFAWVSDKARKRQLAVVIPWTLAGIGLIVSRMIPPTAVVGTVAVLVLTGIGLYSPIGAWWGWVLDQVPKDAAGAVIGLVNMIGAGLGGFAGVWAVGILQGATGSFTPGFIVLGAACLLAAGLTFVVRALERRRAAEPVAPFSPAKA